MQDKLPLNLTGPAGSSTCPATLLNKGEIGLSPKHYLTSGASQGLVKLAQLPCFLLIHFQLALGQVIMLHAKLQGSKKRRFSLFHYLFTSTRLALSLNKF